jgi:acylphosphatase
MVGKQIFVSGIVQGVGFRYFAQARADILGLVGWARNLDDGDVEIQVFGKTEALTSYLAQLKLGPPRSKVTKIDEREVEISEDMPQNFEIRPNGSRL